MPRPIRTLLLSPLYPGSARSGYGILVETRLRELLCTSVGKTRVPAPAASVRA